MTKIKSWRIVFFAITLAAAAGITIIQQARTIPAGQIAITGAPLVDESGDLFVSEMRFGNGGYGVICFDSPENMQEFAQLESVKVGL